MKLFMNLWIKQATRYIKGTIICDVTSFSLVKFTVVSEECAASIHKIKEYVTQPGRSKQLYLARCWLLVA
jgi:hypothetical protein